MVDRNLVRYARAVIETGNSVEIARQNLVTLGGWKGSDVDASFIEAEAELHRIQVLKKSALEFQNGQTNQQGYTKPYQSMSYGAIQIASPKKNAYNSTFIKPVVIGVGMFIAFALLAMWLLSKTI